MNAIIREARGTEPDSSVVVQFDGSAAVTQSSRSVFTVLRLVEENTAALPNFSN
ncbi:MAG: hypothetical protein ABIQ35_13165 [Verrucomicrobiota bacterium]